MAISSHNQPVNARTAFVCYTAAVLSIVAATIVREMLDPALGNHLPFVTYFVAVMFSAWYSGKWPSWLALGLGYLASDYFFVPPRKVFGIAGLPNQVGMGLYFFVGVSSILLSNAYRAALRRAEASERELLENQKVLEKEITDRRLAEERLKASIIHESINEVLKGRLKCRTEEELGKECLDIAQKLTGSKFGFFGEINSAGLFDTIAISNPGWDECKVPEDKATLAIKNMEIRGVDRGTMREGKSRIVNGEETIKNHPDHVEVPEGHPPLAAFLGVPFILEGKTIGMIGLGNKEGGYAIEDQEKIEVLSTAIVEALRNKRTEEKLKKSEDRYRTFTTETYDVVWTTNAEGLVVADLPAWRELTGQTEEEIKGWGWIEALHPDDREEVEKVWKSAVETGSHYATEFRARRHDGVYRHLMVRGVPIFEEDGGIREWMGICSDVTQDKELQEKLGKAEKLAAVGRLAGAVGHDLRNPLGVISNAVFYLDMKLKDADDKVREYLKILKREVEKGNGIIGDLLDFSRTKPPSLEKSDINAVVREALDASLTPDNIMVEKESGPGLPEILIDRDRIRRAFLNLITNAFQAMPGGGKLAITARAREGFVEIKFQDAGAGIPEKHIQDIFEPLFTLKAKGTGLGLSIVKNIIEEHKGTIEVESKEGQGAAFTVKLPVQ